jgi:hypothetical protein
VQTTTKEINVDKALRKLIASGFVGTTAREIAKELAKSTGLSANYLRQHEAVLQYLAISNAPKSPEGAPEKQGRIETERTDTSFKATGEGFATVDEVVAKAGIDLTRWRIVKVKTGSWYMGYKDAENVAQKIPLYTFAIECAPIDRNAADYMAVREAHIEALNAAPAPQYQTLQRTPHVGGVLLVLDPADVHFGKYAALAETGETYNLEIARQRVIEGVAAIVGQAVKAYQVDRIMLVIGNDVLHVDNTVATTTRGTFQNTAGMWFEMFEAAKRTFIDVIESLVPIADVDVIFNPGNHDYQSGYMLADTLSSWFRSCKNVTFDASITHRKYYQFGNSLIGTTHGDGAKPVDLPSLMAYEVPQLWATTKYRYVYTHHVHHKDRSRFLETKDFIGVTVEAVRSPSATDSWHATKGYTGVAKAVEGFIHSKDKGQIARITHVF